MPVPQVANPYLELVKKSRLLAPEQLAEVVSKSRISADTPAKTVATQLVKDGLLTRFQAERLLEGKARGFFIGNYKALEILGSGGMGRLYVAEDLLSGQKVAVKLLPERHEGDAGMLTRFRLEARAGLKLNHPNVVKAYKFDKMDGIYGDIYYLVMEFVEAISLEELIALNGPCPWPQACDFIRQAGAGLQHAHDSGIIHRDVKPANLLVDHQGNVKVLDFGLSLWDREGDEFSLAMIFGHDCLGTADYIAPEQTIDSYKVDARADVYSLGCTFYSALTGKVPFGVTKTSQKLEAHRTQRVRPVGEVVKNIPPQVAAIVEKMLAKEPDDRFRTTAEVCQALARFAKRQPARFNFPKVLSLRAALARKRLAALRKQSGKSSVPQSSVLPGSESRPGTKPPQSTIDTAMREDTRPDARS